MFTLTKRSIDIVLSALFIFLAFPIILLFVVCIGVVSKGAPFYCQERLGLNGTLFRMWKIRTMFSNSDELLKKHFAENPSAREEWDNYFCLKSDPRIAGRIGRFARKFSIDELPQFYNVLKGEMSLVGPRPVPIEEHLLFPNDKRDIRNSVKPGVTGLWQISGRSEMTIYEKLELDLRYIKEKSLLSDIKILLLTPVNVISSKGAF